MPHRFPKGTRRNKKSGNCKPANTYVYSVKC